MIVVVVSVAAGVSVTDAVGDVVTFSVGSKTLPMNMPPRTKPAAIQIKAKIIVTGRVFKKSIKVSHFVR